MATYATVEALKKAANITTDTNDDVLEAWLTAASDAINRFTNHPDGFEAGDAAARTFVGTGRGYIFVDEFISVTKVEVKESPTDDTYVTWASTDYVPFSGSPEYPDFNPVVKGKPYSGIMVTANADYTIFTSGRLSGLRGFRPERNAYRPTQTVQITARWGYSESPPAVVKQAALAQAVRWYKRAQGAMSDTTGSPEFGQQMFVKALDPAVQMMLVNTRLVRPAV